MRKLICQRKDILDMDNKTRKNRCREPLIPLLILSICLLSFTLTNAEASLPSFNNTHLFWLVIDIIILAACCIVIAWGLRIKWRSGHRGCVDSCDLLIGSDNCCIGGRNYLNEKTVAEDDGGCNSADFCSLPPNKKLSQLELLKNLVSKHLECFNHEGGKLILVFAFAARRDIKNIVDMERQCCAQLALDVYIDPNSITLSVSSSEANLTQIRKMLLLDEFPVKPPNQ
jgi:hypothetical protein